MNLALCGLLARHALTGLAGILAANGFIKPEEANGLVEVLLPAVLAVIAVAWSYWQKKRDEVRPSE
jgi:membrane protein DedA with SNARE-associated domain